MKEDDPRSGWSDQLPDHWIWAGFSDVFVDFTDSKRKLAKAKYLPEGDYPVIDQGEGYISGYTDDHSLISPASVPCIVWGDHTRRAKFVEERFVQGADGVKVLVPTALADPFFVYKLLEFADLPDKGYSRHYKFLRAKEFPIPPLPEQRRIVRKLNMLSARTITVRAHLNAIERLVERYKAAVLFEVFNGLELKTTPLRNMTSLVTSGSRGWAKYYADTGAAFIRVGETRRGSPVLDLSDIQYVNPPTDGEGKRTRLRSGDLVISITADLGRIGVVPNDLGEAYVNQHIALVRPNDPGSAYFIAWYLISPHGQAQLLENDRGATKAGLGLEDIRGVLIPDCTPTKQHEVVRTIEAAFAKIDRLAAETAKALNLTDRLDERILAKAFLGQLVPQDPSDEPAEGLLDRIRAEKQKQPKTRRGRRAKEVV